MTLALSAKDRVFLSSVHMLRILWVELINSSSTVFGAWELEKSKIKDQKLLILVILHIQKWFDILFHTDGMNRFSLFSLSKNFGVWDIYFNKWSGQENLGLAEISHIQNTVWIIPLQFPTWCNLLWRCQLFIVPCFWMMRQRRTRSCSLHWLVIAVYKDQP